MGSNTRLASGRGLPRGGSVVVGFLLAVLPVLLPARAALQFDVFLGYGGQPTGAGGYVREGSWFAVGCEVLNDGPPFHAVFEVAHPGGPVQRLPVELPTNTRKRFSLPAFCGSGQFGVWDIRLLDERGQVRAEHLNVRPAWVAWEGLLVGAVPRTYTGLPKLPPLPRGADRGGLQPCVARIPVEQLPDNPVAFEALGALYLNSEKAVELKQPQSEALLAWVHAGGHLVLAVEQPGDVNATAWLRSILPCTVGNMVPLQAGDELHHWLLAGAVRAEGSPPPPARAWQGAARPDKYGIDRVPSPLPPNASNPLALLAADPAVGSQEFPAAVGTVRDGEVSLALGGAPLIVTAPRGHGRVTVLLFSPEREPFRSWKQSEWFWARLLRVPASWYGGQSFNLWGGQSADGAFGAMIDSRQVRKLPVVWLLLLLLLYLVVIGPLDQYLLRRLNRQMLTWITFPSYVVLFSLLIYYIGYRLRAGETEWNELHVVDILPRTGDVALRGRTYASIYSPVNARYPLASDLPHATLRSEFMAGQAASRDAGSSVIRLREAGFSGETFVPVWTSQLLSSDWWFDGQPPLVATLQPGPQGFQLQVENKLPVPLSDLRLVFAGRTHPLDSVPAGATRTFGLEARGGANLTNQVNGLATEIRGAVQARQRAFGGNVTQWLEPGIETLQALSFLSVAGRELGWERQFVYPDGLDLAPLADRGEAVLLAWVPGHAPVPSLGRFEAKRSSRNTLFRLVIPGRPAS